MRYPSISTLTLCGLGACSSTPTQAPPGRTTDLRLPSIDAKAVQLGGVYSGAAGQSSMPCLVRYDFAAPLNDVDCTTQQVDGPLDWEILCPAHAALQPVNELRVRGGRLAALRQWVHLRSGLDDRSELHGPQDRRERPADQVALRAARHHLPRWRAFPGDITISYGYDAFDRLTAEAFSFTATGVTRTTLTRTSVAAHVGLTAVATVDLSREIYVAAEIDALTTFFFQTTADDTSPSALFSLRGNLLVGKRW